MPSTRPSHLVDRSRPHPWHGLPVGPEPPSLVYAFIEMTVFDLLKCEVDKPTGYVRIDRTLPSSSLPPAAYGFIPQTYCAERIAALAGTKKGDGDPLDILVVSERQINRAELLAPARVLGGFQLIDRGEADDKIVAVLDSDLIWGRARALDDLPLVLVDRIEHYLRTYKQIAGKKSSLRIARRYGPAHAKRVVRAAMADYLEHYGKGTAR